MAEFVLVAAQWVRNNLVTSDALKILESAGTVRELDVSAIKDPQERRSAFVQAAAGVDAAVFGPWGDQGLGSVSPGCWDDLPGIRVIAGTFDNRFEQSFSMSLKAAHDRGITVIDTSRTMTPTVAEFALAMIFNLLRDIPVQIQKVREGGWNEGWPNGWPDLSGFVAGDLKGKRVALAGYGVISRTLRGFLVPFECEVATYDPFADDDLLKQDRVSRASSLVELASNCEIFVVGIPPTPATLGIINREVIYALPKGSLFVLPTRMAVVEQEALWERTSAAQIKAAIDVFEPEPPPPDSPIRTYPNVLPTPHIAGNTAYCHRRCFTAACEDAVAAVQGKPTRWTMTLRDAALYRGVPVEAEA